MAERASSGWLGPSLTSESEAQSQEAIVCLNFLLEMRNICKDFPGVRVLDNVNLSVRKGTIHALVGENGAGKSTLMNILSGLYPYGTL